MNRLALRPPIGWYLYGTENSRLDEPQRPHQRHGGNADGKTQGSLMDNTDDFCSKAHPR
jgi:hypothetical protein